MNRAGIVGQYILKKQLEHMETASRIEFTNRRTGRDEQKKHRI